MRSAPSPDYIRGLLHAYAGLNMPDSEPYYDYELIEIPRSETLLVSLKRVYLNLSNQEMQLEYVTDISFRDAVLTWFFRNGELAHLQISERHKAREIDYFLESLRSALQPVSISRIVGFSDPQSYDLGIFYEYFVLQGNARDFLLYFRYDD